MPELSPAMRSVVVLATPEPIGAAGRVIAYSPTDHGRLLDQLAVKAVAIRHHATPAQVAIAWVLHHDGVSAIPKAATPAHVRQNRAALDLELTNEDLATLDEAFPPPAGPQPLEIL